MSFKREFGSALEELSREIRCQVCLSVFDDPHFLPCSHTFCLGCIRRAESSSRSCPLCRKPFQRRTVRRHPMVAEIVSCYRELLPESLPMELSQPTCSQLADFLPSQLSLGSQRSDVAATPSAHDDGPDPRSDRHEADHLGIASGPRVDVEGLRTEEKDAIHERNAPYPVVDLNVFGEEEYTEKKADFHQEIPKGSAGDSDMSSPPSRGRKGRSAISMNESFSVEEEDSEQPYPATMPFDQHIDLLNSPMSPSLRSEMSGGSSPPSRHDSLPTPPRSNERSKKTGKKAMKRKASEGSGSGGGDSGEVKTSSHKVVEAQEDETDWLSRRESLSSSSSLVRHDSSTLDSSGFSVLPEADALHEALTWQEEVEPAGEPCGFLSSLIGSEVLTLAHPLLMTMEDSQEVKENDLRETWTWVRGHVVSEEPGRFWSVELPDGSIIKQTFNWPLEILKSPPQFGIHLDRRASTLCSSVPSQQYDQRPATILTSSLSESVLDALESILTAQGNLKFNVVSSFSEKVTHVIVPSKSASDEERMECMKKLLSETTGDRKMVRQLNRSQDVRTLTPAKRTMKLMQGVANKAWVLSSDWVWDSMKAGTPVPELPYEISHVVPRAGKAREVAFAFRRSREALSTLFESFTLNDWLRLGGAGSIDREGASPNTVPPLLLVDGHSNPFADLQILVELLGGTLVSHTDRGPKTLAGLPILLCKKGEKKISASKWRKWTSIPFQSDVAAALHVGTPRDLLQGLKLSDIPKLEITWLFDSVTAYSVQEPGHYLL